MGGLETPLGKIVSGKLYRTSAFVPKNRADEEYFRSLALDAVVDFRTEAERKEKPDVLPSGVQSIHASVFDEEKVNTLAPTEMSAKAILSLPDEQLDRIRSEIRNTYREMPFSDKFSEVFRLMDEGKTVAFHCTAGKDRTGMCACLIELSFGRTFDQCLQEYLASNVYREKENAKINTLLKLTGVRKSVRVFVMEILQTHEFLFNEAKAAILTAYKNTDDFLQEVHGVTAERKELWRHFYLAERT